MTRVSPGLVRGLDGPVALTDLPRLILLPCRAQLSGALMLDSAGAKRRIVYSGGWPISASSSSPSEQIEAQLVEAEVITGAQLQKVIAHREAKKVDLQQALLDLDMVSKTVWVNQTIALRQRVVVAALCSPCSARFEASSTDPIGFSSLPLLEYCSTAVATWPAEAQNKVLSSVGPNVLLVQDIEFALMLGPSRGLLSLLQRQAHEPRTAAQVYNADPAGAAELVVAIAAELVGSPQTAALANVSNLDAELASAFDAFRTTAPPIWSSPVLPSIEHKRSRTMPVAIAVGIACSLATWLLSRATRPPPVQPTIVEVSVDRPASQPETVSVLAAAGLRAEMQAARAMDPRAKLDPADIAKVDELVARANASVKKNKLPAAIRDFRSALEIDPTSPMLHRSLAIAYTRAGEIEPALFEYRVYLRLSPYAEDADAVREIIQTYGK